MSKIQVKRGRILMPINDKDILQRIAENLFEKKLISYEEYLRMLAQIERNG